ncbi:MAG: phosphatidylserine decarboxylase family protein [Candidatus Aminicenantes bacterium]|nr:phosphatidylserine decarboxylase family protein [Candidatus Aminicenantes bacterium]
MRIARDGLPFILGSLALSALCGLLGLVVLSLLVFALACAFTFFFRDPDRVPPAGEHLVVSPADGEVLGVEAVEAPPGLEAPATKVTIFLSLFDVHIVRAPLAATVASAEHRPGRFLPAYKPEAGERNESTTLVLGGGRVAAVMKMIVGIAARRIKSYVRAGDAVTRGQKVGMMLFGSRVELTLPRSVDVKLALHDKVKAGETVIGEIQT